jgi:hypothetical protein
MAVGVLWLWIVVGFVIGLTAPNSAVLALWLFGPLGCGVLWTISVCLYHIVEDFT